MTPTVVISVCALAFTIASFWWLNARKGKLLMSAVPAFAGMIGTDGTLLIRIPVLLYNTGARTRTIDELRLVMPEWGDAIGHWERFTSKLQPKDDPAADFAAPYAVDGRRTANEFVTFSLKLNGLPQPRETKCRIELRSDRNDEWELLREFVLYLPHMHTPGRFLTWRNSPELCEGEPEKTVLAWDELAVSRGLPRLPSVST